MAGEEREEGRIEQILVALDPSAHGLAALEAAARLATALRAELIGLYVEDADVLNLPRISFLRETDALSGEVRPLKSEELEKTVRLQGDRLRRRMEEAVEESEVRWSFRVVRGRVRSELLEAAREADLVSLGARSHWMGRDPGTTTRTIVTRAGKPVMVLRRGAKLGRRVCVLYDGTEEAREGLVLGARMERVREDADLFVILHGPRLETARLQDEASSLLEDLEVEAEFSALMSSRPRAVLEHLSSVECGLVVVPRKRFTEEEGQLRRALAHIRCPLLLAG
jgi:nucleotide-binding universal stress UspA family protein